MVVDAGVGGQDLAQEGGAAAPGGGHDHAHVGRSWGHLGDGGRGQGGVGVLGMCFCLFVCPLL